MSRYEGFLCASLNVGHYQVSEGGPDLTMGSVCCVRLGDRWVYGTVSHSRGNVDPVGMMAIEHPGGGMYEGYYLEVETTSGLVTTMLCGLCTGMYVRLL